jgi:hypothetical protein
MDYTRIIYRAWELLKSYRVLWIFGFLLAMTTTSWGTWSVYAINDRWDDDNPPVSIQNLDSSTMITLEEIQVEVFPGQNLPIIVRSTNNPEDAQRLERLLNEVITPDIWQDILTILIFIIAGSLVLLLIAAIIRYVAETALIRMVGIKEQTGNQLSLREGLRAGWSRSAWRLFFIDVLVFLATAVVFILLLAVGALPVYLAVESSSGTDILGILATAGLIFFPLLALLFILVPLISLLVRFFRRACVLDDLGALASIRRGFQVVFANLKDVVVMGLLMLGINTLVVMIAIPIIFTLAPLLIVTLLAGGIAGSLPALIAGGLAALVSSGPVPWIIAILTGLPVLLLVAASPLLFLEGLLEVFKSSTWTLTYWQLRSQASAEPVAAPKYPESGLEPSSV